MQQMKKDTLEKVVEQLKQAEGWTRESYSNRRCKTYLAFLRSDQILIGSGICLNGTARNPKIAHSMTLAYKDEATSFSHFYNVRPDSLALSALYAEEPDQLHSRLGHGLAEPYATLVSTFSAISRQLKQGKI